MSGKVCIIGVFGVPCADNANCTSGLSCQTLLNGLPAKLCTINNCNTHADCQGNRHVGADSYCISAAFPGEPHVCAPKVDVGVRCSQDIQCKSGMCNGTNCVAAGG